MAIFDRVSDEELREEFTHKGWFVACPIWYGEHPDGTPVVSERNWVPEWWFGFNLWLSQTLDAIGVFLSPATYEPSFHFRLTPLWEDDRAHSDQ